MVDFLGFFTRDDFEKYLQLTCKRMNQLILTHFPSKPYRYLDTVTLMRNLNIECNIFRTCNFSSHPAEYGSFEGHHEPQTYLLLDIAWGKLQFDMNRYSEENLMSLVKQLNEAKLFSCRRSNVDIMMSCFPLWEHPEIYSLQLDLIKRVEYDSIPIMQLVKNRALYPQTTFVFMGDKDSYRVL
ncbi:hypothetical protein Ddc_11355 [Ditylenchus destructor]|nr:hypothetical protein Ddc_11355 [Ditylenchus destructor]